MHESQFWLVSVKPFEHVWQDLLQGESKPVVVFEIKYPSLGISIHSFVFSIIYLLTKLKQLDILPESSGS